MVLGFDWKQYNRRPQPLTGDTASRQTVQKPKQIVHNPVNAI